MKKPKRIHLSSTEIKANDVIGQYFPISHFSVHVKQDADCYVDGKLLCSFRQHVVENSQVLECLQTNIVNKFLMSDHRKVATGVVKKRVVVPSGVFGYYDKLTPQMKKKLGGVHIAGRKTAFVKHHPQKWAEMIPIFKACNTIYKKTCPSDHKKQANFCKKIENDLLIPGTVFSTITINKNFRTCTHTDKGDFGDAMSVLLISGENFQGGYLGFPRLGLLIHCKPGDILFMNSHEPHCNTDINYEENGIRYSIVCYVRTNMDKFHKKKTVDQDVFYVQ